MKYFIFKKTNCMTTFYDPYKIQMFFTALLRFYDKKSSVFAAGFAF